MSTVFFILVFNLFFFFSFFLLKNFPFAFVISLVSLFLIVRVFPKQIQSLNHSTSQYIINTVSVNKFFYLKIVLSLLIFLITSSVFNFIIGLIILAFTLYVFFNLESRFFFTAAIALLILTPFSLSPYSYHYPSPNTDTIVTIAYFLLIIGTIIQIIEIKKQSHEKETNS